MHARIRIYMYIYTYTVRVASCRRATVAHMPALAPSLCLSGESDVSVSGSFIEAASLLLMQVELVYASRQGKRCWTLPRVYCLVSRLPCLPALFNLLLAVLHQVSALAPRTDLFHESLAPRMDLF
jgi:hypothetical protein